MVLEAISERHTELPPPLQQETLALSGTRTSDRSPWSMLDVSLEHRGAGVQDCSSAGDGVVEALPGGELLGDEEDEEARRTLVHEEITGESTVHTGAGVEAVTVDTTAGTRSVESIFLCSNPSDAFPQPQRIRDWSITIGSDWDLLEEIAFTRLQKLTLPVEQPEDLCVVAQQDAHTIADGTLQVHSRYHLCLQQAVRRCQHPKRKASRSQGHAQVQHHHK